MVDPTSSPPSSIRRCESMTPSCSAVADGSSTVSSGEALNPLLGMTLAPNGDLFVLNGNNGNAVEITRTGTSPPRH
jgi:hypothetical protein